MKIAEVAVPIPLYPLDKLFDYKIPLEINDAVVPGTLVTVPIGSRKSWGIVWNVKDESNEKKLKSILDIRFETPVLSPKKIEFGNWLSRRYFYPIGEVCEAMLPAAIRKGSVKLLTKEFRLSEERASPALTKLNAEQLSAFEQISKNDGIKQHLLWGVTGSGKTEVYLHLIGKNLKEGKGAIVLVPEIALTPQLFNRFENAFPNQVAVFHSAQSEKELREEWLKVYKGTKMIALGPRSALFAPLPTLGMVIIDEEHENSYKQEDRLRYHGRTAAEKLCSLMDAQIVFGSATPSAETLKRALDGEITLSRLPKRAVEKSKKPEVVVVDLKKNLTAKTFTEKPLPEDDAPLESFDLAPQSLFFSRELIVELERAIKNKEQSILFLNRRGMGRALICRVCGYQPECVQCAVNLVPHKNKMLCHYCGFECIIPAACEKCKGELKELGYGTQALEEELQRIFPGIKSLRLDRDIVQDRKQLVETLKAFADQKAEVLIGTQMVAKGHDFPQVSLVGVVLADVGFNFPDFRNEERVFQLLTQVSGRAGRAQIPGKVILQTFRPNEFLFQEVQKGEALENFEEFLLRILASRKALHYPPYSQIAVLHFQGLYEEKVAEAARTVAAALQRIKKDNFFVLGAVPAPVLKVRNKYRYHVLIKSPTEELLENSLHWIHKTWEESHLERKFKGTRMIIDIDPMQLS